ncbi:MAG: lipopolysaccharide biosynthesis protein [Comamonadaceae bacterium]|nr:MAG: lipopolysaccharide biosynthesis protein [Comamonadaceae bacterium]
MRSLERFNVATLIVVGRLLVTASSLVSAPIVARSLGPEGRGESAAAVAAFFIAPVVLALGIPLEVRRTSARDWSYNPLPAARRYAILSLIPAIGFAAALYFTLFAQFETTARLVAALGIVLTPLSVNWACDTSALVARKRYASVFAIQLAQPAIYVPAIVVLWLTSSATLATVLAAYIGGNVAAFVMGVICTRRILHGVHVELRELLRGGARFSGAAIAEVASNRLDQALALPIIGASGAGLYSVAVTVASAPVALAQALNASTFVTISRARDSERRSAQLASLRMAVLTAAIACPVTGLIAWPLIPAIFGAEFSAARELLLLQLPGTAALIVAVLASMALVTEQRGGLLMLGQVTGLIAGIALLATLGTLIGPPGAALASSIGYAVLLGTLLAGLRVRPKELVPRRGDLASTRKAFFSRSSSD